MIAEWSRICLKVILVFDTASKMNFGPRNRNFIFLKSAIFSFRPKLTCSVTNFKIHPVEYVQPRGPFLFSVKKGRDVENGTKNNKIGKFHFFRLSGKFINSSGVSSQKLSYVYEAPAGAFISAKLTFLGISDIPILEKVCISSYLVFPFHFA